MAVFVEIINSLVFLLMLNIASFWNLIAQMIASGIFNILLCYSYELELRSNFGLKEKNNEQTLMYHEFLNAQTNPILIFKKKEGIIFINNSAVQEFGSQKLEIILDQLYQFNCAEGKPMLEYLNACFNNSSQPIPEKIFYRTKPPSNEDHIYKAKFIQSSFFKNRSTMGLVLYNITQQVKWEQIQIKERCSNLLLCGVSHELRTPINGIRGLISMAKPCTNQEGKKYLSIAKANIFCLGSKIEDILDYIQKEIEDLVLHIERVNLKVLLKKIYKACKYEAQEKKIEFIFDVDPSIEFISVDSKRLTQILINLFTNALKYTIQGNIVLKIRAKPQANIKISVIDSGIGLSSSQIKNLLYSQTRNRTQSIIENRKIGLPGIGLQVTQILCKKMNSQLHVKSQKGKGSKFYFQFSQRQSRDENSFQNNQINNHPESNNISPKINNSSSFLSVNVSIPNKSPSSSNHCHH